MRRCDGLRTDIRLSVSPLLLTYAVHDTSTAAFVLGMALPHQSSPTMPVLHSGVQAVLDLIPIPPDLLAALCQDWGSSLRILVLDATEAPYGLTSEQYTLHLSRCGLFPSRTTEELRSRVE